MHDITLTKSGGFYEYLELDISLACNAPTEPNSYDFY